MKTLKDTVENYIRTRIPLTNSVDIKISEISAASAIFTAPLEPNINDKSVGFAGSIETLLTITAWGWLFGLFQNIDPLVQLYIRRCSFEFNRPVEKEMTAFTEAPDSDTVAAFFADYKTAGKARIKVRTFIGEKDYPDAEFSGQFTALSLNNRFLLLNR